MSSQYPDSRKTGQQLRTELIAQMNAAIDASGLPDGWNFGPASGSEAWDPATEEFLGARCITQPGHRGQRFDIALFHEPDGDPVAFATKMGEFWKGQGFTVKTVGGIDLGPRHATDFTARRLDGSLYASVTAMTTHFSLTAFSECSTDPSLDKFAGPHGYRSFDWNDPDPYHPTNSPSVTPYPSN